MVKRLSKSRRSAILEHLLALEKQIRMEFGGDNAEVQAAGTNPARNTRKPRSSMRREEHEGDEQGRLVSNEFTARSMH